jgi:hypothetical protein
MYAFGRFPNERIYVLRYFGDGAIFVVNGQIRTPSLPAPAQAFELPIKEMQVGGNSCPATAKPSTTKANGDLVA